MLPAGTSSELLPGATRTFGTSYIRMDRHGNVYRGCNTPLTPAQVHDLGLPPNCCHAPLTPIAKAPLTPIAQAEGCGGEVVEVVVVKR